MHCVNIKLPAEHREEVRSLRIACYGYAAPSDGSVSSAGHVILNELLNRGVEVDFFGKRSFAYPVGLERFSNFRYIEVEGPAERTFGHHAVRGPKLWRALMGSLTSGQTARNITSAVCISHRSRHYAVQLFLGTWAFGRVPGIPTVSWVQGPPGTDSRSIANHAQQLRRLEGLPRYMVLRALAAYRNTLGTPPFRNTDVAICGSRWAAGILRGHVSPGVEIDTIPYPVDLEMFSPDPLISRSVVPEVLWVGRSVPRKRLDLFLSACEQLIRSGRPLSVRVVGGLGFAPGFQKLIDTFRFPGCLTWSRHLPRTEIPALLRRATVLIQPSEEENFGSSVAEALACGTPVVVGPTNGTGDYMADGGVLFDAYNPASVANAIAAALDGIAANPHAWRARARAAAEQFCDVRSIVTQLEAVIHRALAPTPRVGLMPTLAASNTSLDGGAIV